MREFWEEAEVEKNREIWRSKDMREFGVEAELIKAGRTRNRGERGGIGMEAGVEMSWDGDQVRQLEDVHG